MAGDVFDGPARWSTRAWCARSKGWPASLASRCSGRSASSPPSS
jgi:hypothetical protein